MKPKTQRKETRELFSDAPFNLALETMEGCDMSAIWREKERADAMARRQQTLTLNQ